jgi:hypothetical protein
MCLPPSASGRTTLPLSKATGRVGTLVVLGNTAKYSGRGPRGYVLLLYRRGNSGGGFATMQIHFSRARLGRDIASTKIKFSSVGVLCVKRSRYWHVFFMGAQARSPISITNPSS